MAQSLTSLKVKSLKYLALLTGCATAQGKSALQVTLQRHLQQPLLPRSHARILSIDMGIRNLAYCVIEVPPLSPRKDTKAEIEHTDVDNGDGLRVTAWEKLDIVKQLRRVSKDPLIDNVMSVQEQDLSSKKPGSEAIASPENVLFTPAVMSQAAYNVAQLLLKHKPTTILIERQRFRSGGGSAIQEWTVRVNMLESMLWACFETLNRSRQFPSSLLPALHEVSPARVARFWIEGRRIPLLATDDVLAQTEPVNLDSEDAERKKISKNDKMSVLKEWLSGNGDWEVSMKFDDSIQETVEAFMPKSKAKRRPASKLPKAVLKLDDLADCMLQSVAWIRWEENRGRISRLLSKTCGAVET